MLWVTIQSLNLKSPALQHDAHFWIRVLRSFFTAKFSIIEHAKFSFNITTGVGLVSDWKLHVNSFSFFENWPSANESNWTDFGFEIYMSNIT